MANGGLGSRRDEVVENSIIKTFGIYGKTNEAKSSIIALNVFGQTGLSLARILLNQSDQGLHCLTC